MAAEESSLFDLDAFAATRRLGDWQFAQFKRYVGPRTVEIGAGIGTFSERLLACGVRDLLAIEPNDVCARELEARFDGDERVRIVRETVLDSPTLRAEGSSSISLFA